MLAASKSNWPPQTPISNRCAKQLDIHVARVTTATTIIEQVAFAEGNHWHKYLKGFPLFSPFYRGGHYLSVIPSRERFPVSYVLASCSSRQLSTPFDLFHLSGEKRFHPFSSILSQKMNSCFPLVTSQGVASLPVGRLIQAVPA